MTRRRLEMVIHGRVQGVGFRWFARDVACELGLVGYVRNTRRGDVEFVAEGEEEVLEEVRRRLMRGPGLARVSGAEANTSDATGDYVEFRISI